jgi:hypothetical protein
MPKKYHGDSPGNDALDSLGKALHKAWQDAKADGKQGKKLKVDEWYVKGDNPLNWSSVVLVDEDA